MKRTQMKNGVLVLIIMSIIAKVIGVFYRIPLFAVLGANGMGLYQLVFPIYALAVAFTGGGSPVAVSRFVSLSDPNNRENVEKITDSALVVFGGIGVSFSILLTVFAQYVAVFLGNLEAIFPLVVLAPSVFFSSIIAVLRGYYQGCKKAFCVGVSFVCEQVLKLFGVGFAVLFSKNGNTVAVVGAVLGITLGELVTALFLLCGYLRKKRCGFRICKTEIKRLFSCGIAVSLGLLISPLSALWDGVMVVNVLSYIESREIATALYGLLSGVVNPLISMPSVITSSFCSWLLPKLCAEEDVENRKIVFRKYARFPLALSLAIAISVSIFSQHILTLLYPLSVYEVNVCKKLLTVGSAVVFLSCALSLITTYLQSMNKTYLPPVNLLIATIVKIFVLPFMIKNYSVYGAQACNVLTYLVAFTLGCFQAIKQGLFFSAKTMFTLFISSATYLFFAGGIYLLAPSLLGCVIGAITGLSVGSVVLKKSLRANEQDNLLKKFQNITLKRR